jgi:hypothetical protein
MTGVLYAAAAYNVAWGAFVVLFPLALFEWAGMPAPNYPGLWQCAGMMAGVYGVGYLAAARDPVTHWPVVLVGLLGKVVVPIGVAAAAARGELPWALGATILAGDVVWWAPFALILHRAYRRHAIHLRLVRDHRSLRRA